MDLNRITLVLDQIRHPDNLGSALRAMKNCALSRLTLSNPRTHDFERAQVMALDASDLLKTMKVTASLEEAVAHGTLVAGTTSRKLQGRPTIWLRDFITQASNETDAGGEAIIVFGNEQRGLSDAELDYCQVAVNIPTSPAKDSINLAQAVMLTAHECYLASLKSVDSVKCESLPLAASAGTTQALFALMRQTLLDVDFLNQQNPDDILSEIKRTIERARPTQREVELLLSAFKHLARSCRNNNYAR